MLLDRSLPFNHGESSPEFEDQPASLEAMHREAEVQGGTCCRGGKAGTGRLWSPWLADTGAQDAVKIVSLKYLLTETKITWGEGM